MNVAIASLESFRYHSTNPLDLATVLAEAGHQVTVFAPFHEPERYATRPFGVVTLPPPAAGALAGTAWIGKLVTAILRQPFDLVIGVNAPGYIAAHICHRLGRIPRLAYYALELSLPEDPGGRWSPSVRYQMRFARDAHVVITTGVDRAETMVKRLGLDAMPLALENSPLESVPPSSSLLRQKVAGRVHPGARHLVVYTGGLGSVNAIPQLMQASSLWRDDVALVLIGFGPADTLAELKAAAERSRGRVCYLGSVEGDRNELLRHTAGADIGIGLTLHADNGSLNVKYWTPNKLFDYMACGLPVVCSDNPSLGFVEQEGWGLLVNAAEPRSIAEGVNRAIAGRERMASRARTLFASTYNYRVRSAEAVRSLSAGNRAAGVGRNRPAMLSDLPNRSTAR